MKKLLIACAAAFGVSLALGVSAFADPVANSTYDATDNTVDVVSTLSGYSGQMTVIVIPASAYTSGTITDSDILYIDQTAAASGIFQDMGLKGASLADGDYYIKIGGENIASEGIIVEKFTVTTTPSGTVYTVGDVDGNGSITIGDVTTLIDYILGNIEYFTDSSDEVLPYFVGDVDGNESVTIGDVTTTIDLILGNIEAFDNAEYTLAGGVTAVSTYN